MLPHTLTNFETQKYYKNDINNKSMKTNIFRIQAYNSIMCGYFCFGFINFMLKGKKLTESLFT